MNSIAMLTHTPDRPTELPYYEREVGGPRIEQMVLALNRLSLQRSVMLTVLLGSTSAVTIGGCSVLRPLWADEAIHRAYNLVILATLLDRQIPQHQRTNVASHLEFKNALALAEAYRALTIGDQAGLVTCSDVMRTITLGLVDLFGPAVGNIEVRTHIQRLSLNAIKRRALVLACHELVINGLRHAFHQRSNGLLIVKLVRRGQRHARLTVADSGIGMSSAARATSCGVAADLALLLDSGVEYRSSNLGGAVAAIDFMAINDPNS